MKAVRTHEYRIDGYGTVMFIKTQLASGHYSFKVFGEKREKKREPALLGCKKAESRRRSWRYSGARWPAPKKTAWTCIITTIKG
jgi:hypothetical protein